MSRCCCGKIDFDNDLTPICFNETMHEVLGPEGNFCGPVISHTLRNLERQIDNLKTIINTIEDRHHPDSEWCAESKEVLG